MPLTIPEISGELIITSAEAVFYIRPEYSMDSIIQYVQTSQENIEKSLEAGVLLGFLRTNDNDEYEVDEQILRLITHTDDLGRRLIFRMQLNNFRPFELFAERIFCGDSSLEAARKVKQIHDLTNNFVTLKGTLENWGLYSTCFTQDPIGKLVSASGHDATPQYLRNIQSSIENEEQARTFISTRLGEESFGSLPTEVVNLISSAIVKTQLRVDEKQEIAFSIGTAMEKVLSIIGNNNDPPIDLSGANGINQMADLLRSNDVITKKHVGLIQAVGAFRNAANHGIDNEIGKDWQLSYETIFDIILLLIDIINSLFNWTTRQVAII
jgi:hypothetical protein